MMTIETETQRERSEPIAASITAACELWWVNSGKFTPDAGSAHWGAFWEPLKVDLPESAVPSYCYTNQIAFYDRTETRLLKEYVSHYAFTGIHPHLLYLDGLWREVVNGRVEFRDGEWWMRWGVSTNTRMARMMNCGFEEWQNG